MYPTQLHSYLLWRSSVDPDPQSLASRRHTAAVSLIPAVMAGVFVFGWWAGWLLLLSVLAAIATDTVCHRFIYPDSSGTRDGTWLLTGLLLALLMPPHVAWWLPVLGAVLAIFVGKYYLSVDNMPLFQPAALGVLLLCLFGALGGLFTGNNPMAPTRDGRAQWPVLSHALEPTSASTRDLLSDFLGGDVRKSVSVATHHEALASGKIAYFDVEKQIRAEAVYGPRPLDRVKAEPSRSVRKTHDGVRGTDSLDMVLGYIPGTVGGTSALALILGILLLVFTGAASWVLPVTAVATIVAALHLLAWLYGGSPDARIVPSNVPIHILTGSTLLALFYLAADPTTAPRSFMGKVYAGLGLGLLEVILRLYTPLTDGLFLSVILLQAFAIVIDQRLAPPVEKPRSSPNVGLSPSSLGRL
jgi:electron transport complex protein RnfD